ncbi:hypothetical protein [Streptomyces sp. YS-3]|uniref:hypothetical protein n=1 Tax=Streptomyces sp. YS-3 TaxID=3381352 RepID=UPI0038623FD6
MRAALRILVAGAMALGLPLPPVASGISAAAATSCATTYQLPVVAGYEGRYTERGASPYQPTCSVFTNTSLDGAVLLIRSQNGDVDSTSASTTPTQWAADSARQAAQDFVARDETVVLPGESVVLNYRGQSRFTVSLADIQINAASKLADGIVAYGIKRARAAGLDKIENRINLQTNIVACAKAASDAWSQARERRTLPDLALVLQQTEQAVSGPCRTAYDTIRDFDARAPEPRASKPWQEALEWARGFNRPYWENALHQAATAPLGELLLHAHR